MSELDADLYGDLYGNDDGGDDIATLDDGESLETPGAGDLHTEYNDSTAKQTETSTAQAARPSLASYTPTNGSAVKFQNAPAATPSTSSAAGASAQMNYNSMGSYNASPALQKIPTYEESTDEYRVGGGAGADGKYAPGAERTIRPSEMKDEGKMFIGGLNWDTTDDGLRDYFSQFGKVDACTIMRDAAGRSRCFAFLTFDDPASVNAVMVREHTLDGKIIDPKRAIPRQEHQRATKLFIGGLPGTVTSESMREFFSQFGKVIDSTVMLDRETGRSKGFGFVSFEDTDVRPFLGYGNLQIDGKLIDVKLAQPRYQRDNLQEGEGGGAGAADGFVGGATRFPNVGAGAPGGQPQQPAGFGNTPFDPQALANLYTRMFQMSGGMNPGMMSMGGGMNPSMMGMGGAGGFPGMRGGGMMGMGGMGGMMGMGRGGQAGGQQGGVPGVGGGGVPRGPRGGSAGPHGHGSGGAPGAGGQGQGQGGVGVGPQRSGQRGTHSFHPYAR